MAGGPGFGALLRGLRVSAALTQEELADRAGVSSRAVRDLERGAVGAPRESTAAALADALGLAGTDREGFLGVARAALWAGRQEGQGARGGGEPADGGMVAGGVAGHPGLLVPAQLPIDIADFTGRAQQVELLCDLLAGVGGGSGSVRIAMVAGAGGLGKTSLAVHAAHRVRREFPDGQLYVDLLGTTPHPLAAAEVLARFLRDLGVDGRDIPVSADERAARYRTALAGRRTLVLLDNARDAAQVRPLLPGTGPSAVLVTTRSRMPELASTRLVDLDVLGDDEALALFAKVVGDERVAAEPEATAGLLGVCAGLPLAIRICAARLATRSGWTIQAMTGRLQDERRRLDEMRVGDLAVRASFQVSFTSLPHSTGQQGIDPARAFCLLGLWQGSSISSAAAAALFGIPGYSAEDALEVLVDAHLLESPAPGRYRFHDLLRVYASERAVADLPGHERAAAIGRLLGWYMRTADAAATAVSPHRYNLPLDEAEDGASPPLGFTGVDDALRWYDGERANVVTATKQASEHGLHDVAWRLPASLFNMFNRRGNWTDLVTTHRVALASVRRVGNLLGEAWVLNNLGQALGHQGLTEGIDHLERALDIRREHGDRTGEAQAALNLADVQYLVNGPEVALPYLRQSLDIQRAVGHPEHHGAALNNLGEIYLELGQLNEALGCLTEALPIFTATGSTHGEGHVLLNLGRVYLGLDRERDALDCLRRALGFHEDSGDRPNQGLTLRFLAQAQLAVGHPDQARESLSRALAIFTDLGDAPRIAEAQSELASLTAQRSDSAEGTGSVA